MNHQIDLEKQQLIAPERLPPQLADSHFTNPFVTVSQTEDGVRLTPLRAGRPVYGSTGAESGLMTALMFRGLAIGIMEYFGGDSTRPGTPDTTYDMLCRDVLMVPRSPRWREAVHTALGGDWCRPLWHSGRLPLAAVGALRAEARTVHRQLVPVWRRRTRHGRVLSLDADLGDGLSLYDLVVTDVDLLALTPGGVFEDERLNVVLRGLDEIEQRVVFAYAEGEGTTWTEAAAAVGAAAPDAFGDRVRRKAKRLAAEQRRRAAQRRVE